MLKLKLSFQIHVRVDYLTSSKKCLDARRATEASEAAAGGAATPTRRSSRVKRSTNKTVPTKPEEEPVDLSGPEPTTSASVSPATQPEVDEALATGGEASYEHKDGDTVDTGESPPEPGQETKKRRSNISTWVDWYSIHIQKTCILQAELFINS